MKLQSLAIIILLAVVLVAFAPLSCKTGEKSSSDDDDSTPSDDDSTPDDDDNDDATPDDDDDDNSTPPHPPILSNATAEVDTDPDTGDEYMLIQFDICDVGDDLIGGYLIYTFESFPFNEVIMFDQFQGPVSPADDCSNPIHLGFGAGYLYPGYDPTTACILSIQAFDEANYISNEILDICLEE